MSEQIKLNGFNDGEHASSGIGGESIFDRFFYFVSENGYTNVTYPDDWDKKAEREQIIKDEAAKLANLAKS